jgi:hypothetical protein
MKMSKSSKIVEIVEPTASSRKAVSYTCVGKRKNVKQ